eukprot:1066194-Prymnesium_polylepis.1
MHGTQGAHPGRGGGWGGGLGEYAMPTEAICAKVSNFVQTTHATSHRITRLMAPAGSARIVEALGIKA